MQQLKFSRNWNGKLNTRIFTTIRDYNEYNDKRYRIGEKYEVLFKDTLIGIVECIDVVNVQYGVVPKFMRQTDTGYILEECAEIFSHFLKVPKNVLDSKRCIVVLLKFTYRKNYVPYDL